MTFTFDDIEISTCDHSTLLKLETLVRVLQNFFEQVEIKKIKVSPRLLYVEFAFVGNETIDLSDKLNKHIQKHTELLGTRLILHVPETNHVGLEIPKSLETVSVDEKSKSIILSNSQAKLPVLMGVTPLNQLFVKDLHEMQHILLTGESGSGKSVAIFNIIESFISNFSSNDIKFLIYDAKVVELVRYESSPYLAKDFTFEAAKVEKLVDWCLAEQQRRFALMASFGLKEIASFNDRIEAIQNSLSTEWLGYKDNPIKKLPRLVFVLEEYADYIRQTSIDGVNKLISLSQNCALAGIHLILSTSTSGRDVLRRDLTNNLPTKIYLKRNNNDTLFKKDYPEINCLQGSGDAFYSHINNEFLERIQIPYIED